MDGPHSPRRTLSMSISRSFSRGNAAFNRLEQWDTRGHRKSAYRVYSNLPRDEYRPKGLVLWMRTHISLLVALSFLIGSIIFDVSCALYWFQSLAPWKDTLSEKESAIWTKTGSALSFVGGQLYTIGVYAMVLECLNHGTESKTWDEKVAALGEGRWAWWGSSIAYGRYKDLGYMGSLIMFIGGVAFGFATLTGLPNVIPGYPLGEHHSKALVFWLYWFPETFGGVCFTVASTLLMLEAQPKWYKLNPRNLGWQVEFWFVIGSVGFLLCGAWGMCATYVPPHPWNWMTESQYEYQSELSAFWGVLAFTIGSAIEVWEALMREPGPATDEEAAPLSPKVG